MKKVREFKVTTVEHGYALEIGEKGWLLEDEQQLAEAVAFRVALGCKSNCLICWPMVTRKSRRHSSRQRQRSDGTGMTLSDVRDLMADVAHQ